MNPGHAISRASRFRTAPLLAFALCSVLLLDAVGCSSHAGHTSDPQLRKIDDLINAHLPAGTPLTRVTFFLSSRGFPIEQSRDRHVIVAVVRQVDTETLQPVTARITFHFDDNDKLISYNLVPAPDVPVTP